MLKRVMMGVCACAAFLLIPAGCGSSNSTKVEAKSTTTGQELIDLDKARNDGLLTEEEYNKKRKQIIDGK